MKTLLAALYILLALVSSSAADGKKPFGRVTALEMSVGDTLKISYESNGCFHNNRHELVLAKTEKGVTLSGADLSRFWDETTQKAVEGRRRPLLTADLDTAKLTRLDRSFEYLRAAHPDGCTTIDDFTVTQERGGKVIAFEVFRDATCHLDDDKERMSFYELVALISPKKNP